MPITITGSASNKAADDATYYVEGDDIPEGKVIGDIKTPAVAGGEDDTQKVVVETTTEGAEGVSQVTTVTISGRIETGDSLKLNITGGRNENVSEFITLVAGQSYYVKALMKEGGGGDNLAVTWIEAGDDLPANGALPISGEYLSPWLTPAVDDTPPTLSVVRNADGTVTMTFEGTLQTAPTVNGPWTDVNGASPLTVPADQDAAFGRAKK